MFMASDPRQVPHLRRYPHLHGMFRRGRLRHVAPTSAATTARSFARPHGKNGRDFDVEESRMAGCRRDAGGAGRRVGFVWSGSAQAAVVYCKTVGVPKGCVVRPTPVAAAAVVATPAVGVARVGVGAPGVGVRPGTPIMRRSGQPRRPALVSSTTDKSRCGFRSILFFFRVVPIATVSASLSGKRWGNVSLTCVPPAPELSPSSAPQRAARLCILRRPRRPGGRRCPHRRPPVQNPCRRQRR